MRRRGGRTEKRAIFNKTTFLKFFAIKFVARRLYYIKETSF